VAVEYFDALETRSADARAAAIAAALPGQIAHARAQTRHYRHALEGVADDASLATLPVTRKSALIEAQVDDPPFGGVVAAPLGALARVYASPGPINEPEADTPDYWRFARALFATGLRSGQLLHNCFAYHFTPAGFMLEGGARASKRATSLASICRR
jgi:phenylacetate-CoA ligase